MKAPFILSLATALLVAPTATLAQTAGQSMGQTPATMATYVCRPATAQDQMSNANAMNSAHATIATVGNQKMVCMKIDYDAMSAASAKAKTMGSAAEADSAWNQYIQSKLNIPTITLGS